MANIIMEDEPLPQSKIVTVIYAPPGSGKTSVSFTANKPLLYDFDDGLKRAVKRKGAVQFSNWKDVIEFTNNDFDKLDVETVIFDTPDTMLNDFIAQEVGKDKGNSRSNGALTQSGYGAMKHVFDAFFSKFKGNVDIIFICHEQEDKRDDKAVLRPKITGGAYNIIIQKADLIGYMEVTNEDGRQIRRLDFNPNETRYAKNFAEFDVLDVPDYRTPEFDNFLADLIQQAKDKMSSMSEAQLNAQQKVKELNDAVLEVKSLEEANELQKEIYSVSKAYQIQVQKELDDKFILLYTEQIKGAKNIEDFDTVDKLLSPIKDRFKKELVEIYNTVYRRQWHSKFTDKAEDAEAFTILVGEIMEDAKNKIVSPCGIKINYTTLSNELMEAAEQKGFSYNKPLKKFEGDKKSSKDEEKKSVVKDVNNDKKSKEKESDKSNDAAINEMVKLIDDAKTYEDLEPIEERLSQFEEPYKKELAKRYFVKLNSIEEKTDKADS